MKILIVEDEYTLADIISMKLKEEKYLVDVALDGEKGLDDALTDTYDLIILDIMLPKINGIEILKEIKRNNIKSKVIMLTSKSTLEDKLLGFNIGANDYITKPFHMEELIARVNVQLRIDDNNIVSDILKFIDLELDIKNSEILCIRNNERIKLSYKELLIVEYLIKNNQQIVSKEQIIEKIWGLDSEFESNNLEAYLSFIRKKIKLIGSNVNIKAIRNLGYKLENNNDKIKK